MKDEHGYGQEKKRIEKPIEKRVEVNISRDR